MSVKRRIGPGSGLSFLFFLKDAVLGLGLTITLKFHLYAATSREYDNVEVEE